MIWLPKKQIVDHDLPPVIPTVFIFHSGPKLQEPQRIHGTHGCYTGTSAILVMHVLLATGSISAVPLAWSLAVDR